MRALALDTTTPAGSVALVDESGAIAERRGEASRTHAERLPAVIVALLEECRVPMSGVDLFAVASGPGSFTGLRIGIATIQGLAFATGRPAVGVSALEALVHVEGASAAAGTIVGAWIDAHRGEVFSGLYRVAARPAYDPDRLAEIESAAVGDPAATLARWNVLVARGIDTIVGDGAVLYQDVIRRVTPERPAVAAAPLLAAAIGRVAIARARRGESVAPGGIRPLYVRRPDAEMARDKPNVAE